MDPCAEFTLCAIRLAQQHNVSHRSGGNWLLLPSLESYTWDEAAELLLQTSKPVVVGPLVEPGWLAVWPVASLTPVEQAAIQKHMENCVEYFSEKLALIGVGDNDRLVLETDEEKFTMTVSEFWRWVREYAVGLGITVSGSEEPGVGNILVRPPGGGRRPIGLNEPPGPLPHP